jgi:hypothetical protein
MTRRGHLEGSIYRRKSDGRWVCTITVGYEGDKRKRRTFYGKSRPEVAKKLAAAQRTIDDGLPLPAERLTVAAYLDRWLKSAEPSLRANTWRRYDQYVKLHATPKLGRLTLPKLAPHHLQELYAERLDAGLSPTTVKHLHSVLHKALNQATRWGLVVRNVADVVDPPRMARRDMTTLTPEQAQALIEASANERLGAALVVP